jgi:hypothetical protein
MTENVNNKDSYLKFIKDREKRLFEIRFDYSDIEMKGLHLVKNKSIII